MEKLEFFLCTAPRTAREFYLLLTVLGAVHRKNSNFSKRSPYPAQPWIGFATKMPKRYSAFRNKKTTQLRLFCLWLGWFLFLRAFAKNYRHFCAVVQHFSCFYCLITNDLFGWYGIAVSINFHHGETFRSDLFTSICKR